MAVIIKQGDGVPQVQAGTYLAVCSGVWDIGRQKNEYNGEIKYPHQLVIRFELNKTIATGEYAGKRYTLNKFYTASLHERSKLRHDLENWRGKTFTNEELKGFDVSKLIGKNCLVSVALSLKGKAKIVSISPLMDGQVEIKPELDPKETPKWVQKLIDTQYVPENETQEIEYKDEDDVEGVPF